MGVSTPVIINQRVGRSVEKGLIFYDISRELLARKKRRCVPIISVRILKYLANFDYFKRPYKLFPYALYDRSRESDINLVDLIVRSPQL